VLFLRLDKTRFIKLEKARSHKYYTKKPDGKGGWIYYYKLIINKIQEQNKEFYKSEKFKYDVLHKKEYNMEFKKNRR